MKDPSIYAQENRSRDPVASGTYLASLSRSELREHFGLLLDDPLLGRGRRPPERLALTVYSGPRESFGLRASLVTGNRSIPFEAASHFDAARARLYLDVLWNLREERGFLPSTTQVELQATSDWAPFVIVFRELAVTRFELSHGEGQIERGMREPASARLVVELSAPDAGTVRLDLWPVLGDAVSAFVTRARALRGMLGFAPQ